MNALKTSKNLKTKAIDLYCGDYWVTVRKAVENRSNRDPIALFIASAGYGLIASDELVVPYSATFTRNHPDSVCSGAESRLTTKDWWSKMARLREKLGKTPSSIADLANREPRKPILVAMSSDYFHALYDDLLAARKALSNSDLLILISSGIKKSGDLSSNLLPADARLEHYLGGVRSSLNARLALHILRSTSKSGMLASRIAPRIQALLETQPLPRTYDRTRLSDETITAFIQREIAALPSASFTALLRKLRQGGRACEHTRFRALFAEVKLRALRKNRKK